MSLTTPPDNTRLESFPVYYTVDLVVGTDSSGKHFGFNKDRVHPAKWLMESQGTEVSSDWIRGPELCSHIDAV